MKMIITESQYKSILEDIEFTAPTDDSQVGVDVHSKNVKWFDYTSPKFPVQYLPQLPQIMKAGIQHLRNMYDLRTVTVKDDGNIVGFLIFSQTTEKKETISDDVTPYDVILSTAIDPAHRKQGLLKKMIDKAGIRRPFFVHTSHISTPEVWERVGCSPAKDLSAIYGDGNVIMKC